MISDAAAVPAPGRHDVAILGNHLATALLAAILARSGVKTVLVPTEADSGLPAGETTVPYTAELFLLLASKFDVPEIATLAMFNTLPDSIRSACGIKRNLGFLYHRQGENQRPAETLQFNVPAEHSEWHVYRPEVDAYASDLAAAKGAVVLEVNARGGKVKVGADGVSIGLADGRTVQAEYLVNGSADTEMLPVGVHGPAHERAKHRACLLSAHLTGALPFESVTSLRRYRHASPWSLGTLLHVFDGGWVQVVPFGNHDRSGNARCSVSASLDPAQADLDAEPSAQLRQLVQRFPDLQRQLADATVVRPWQAHENWPAIAANCAGLRWFLFDRAAGRHDLLLSRDITMSLELVHAAATGLLRMAKSGDWAGDQMKEIGEFEFSLFDFHDRFVAAGRVASRNFMLWNAYLRVWLLWSILSALSLKRARIDGEITGSSAGWSHVEQFGQRQHWYQVPAGLPDLLIETLHDIESVKQGMPAATAADRIFSRLRHERFVPPLYRFGDPEARYYYFTMLRRFRMLLWVKTTAPPDFRRLLTPENVTARPPSSIPSHAQER